MRLTGRGIGLLVAGVVLLAVGFPFGYPEFAALGSAALVAVIAAAAFVAWRPRLTVVRMLDPDRVMRGEPSRARLVVTNASRLFGANLVARDRLSPGGGVPVPLVRLRPGRETSLDYPVPTSRRGVIDVGPLEIARRDPLGLAAVVRRYGDVARIWVRPRVHPIGTVPVGLSRSMDGRIDRVPHGSITFAALRSYVVGDDLRHVHWRTSARVDELMVREHVDTSLPRVVILLDDRAEAHTVGGDGESTFEAACEAAASVLVAAAREDIQVDLQLVSGGAAGGSTDVNALLDRLAEVSLHTEKRLHPAASLRSDASEHPEAALHPGANDLDASLRRAAGRAGPESLRRAVERLRVRRLGDTLLFLTGRPDAEVLGVVAGLRGAYPSIIAGAFGDVERGLAPMAGMLVVGAPDGEAFAGAWDGVPAW